MFGVFSWWSWCLFFSQPHYFWWLVLSDTIPKSVKHPSWESLEVLPGRLETKYQKFRNFCDFPIWDAVRFHCHVDLPKGTVYHYLPSFLESWWLKVTLGRRNVSWYVLSVGNAASRHYPSMFRPSGAWLWYVAFRSLVGTSDNFRKTILFWGPLYGYLMFAGLDCTHHLGYDWGWAWSSQQGQLDFDSIGIIPKSGGTIAYT